MLMFILIIWLWEWNSCIRSHKHLKNTMWWVLTCLYNIINFVNTYATPKVSLPIFMIFPVCPTCTLSYTKYWTVLLHHRLICIFRYFINLESESVFSSFFSLPTARRSHKACGGWNFFLLIVKDICVKERSIYRLQCD